MLAPAARSEFVRTAPRSRRGSRLWLFVVLGVAGAGGYLGGTTVWYAWHLRSAIRAEQAREYDVAAADLNACLRHRPDNPRAQLLAARLGWRPRIDDLAPGAAWDVPLRDHLKRAETDPLLIEQVTHEEQLIDALCGRLDLVSGWLARRLQDGDEDEVPILEVLTWSNIVLGRLPVAAQAADALLARQPEHARAHYWRGLIRELAHGADGHPDDDYRRAVACAPGVFQFRLALAKALDRRLNTRQEALGLFEALAADKPHDAEVLAGLGRCRLESGNVDGALPALREAVELAADPSAMADLGRALLDAGNAAAAEAILRRAVALAPNARLPNYSLGMCLGRLGRSKEAKPFLDAAARIYADAQRAHELSQQVFRNRTPGPEQRLLLGELLGRSGQEKLGQYWLRSAQAADPKHEPAGKAADRPTER